MERHANLIGVYDAEETIEAKLGSVAAENEKNKSNERPSTCAPPPFFSPGNLEAGHGTGASRNLV